MAKGYAEFGRVQETDLEDGLTAVELQGRDVDGKTVAVPFEDLKEELVNVTEVSIQDESGVEKFKMTDLLKIKGVSFNIPETRVDVDPLVGGVIFVSSTGNDGTAVPENRSKPFLTLNSAITAYWANPTIDYIEIISTGTFTITTAIDDGSTSRKFDLRSEKICTVNLNTTGTLGRQNQLLNFKLPFGTLVFNAASYQGLGGSARTLLNVSIETDIVTYNSTYGEGRLSGYTIKTNTLNANGTVSGVISTNSGGIPSSITAKTINCRGENTMIGGFFIDLTLDFNTLTHDSTFLMIGNSSTLRVLHGSINYVAPYTLVNMFTYTGSSTIIVKYKEGAVINSNVYFGRQNANGNITISGVASYPNSNQVVGDVNIDDTVFFTDATITCKRLVGRRSKARFTITNSYFSVSSSEFVNAELNSFGEVFSANTITFRGQNYVIFENTDSGQLYANTGAFLGTNNRSVNITKGELKTNGTFDELTTTITESPLNQYYDFRKLIGTGFNQATLATTQAIVSATPTVVTFVGATTQENGGLSLIDISTNAITPIAVGDVISVDFALPFITPAGSDHDAIVELREKTTGFVIRKSTIAFLKGAGVSDILSDSWIVPVGSSGYVTNGFELVVTTDVNITLDSKYIAVSRTHKAI